MDIENISEGTGFPALARRLAMNPDYEGFIFRTFDRLSARNLLHLESKLAYLEWKLDQENRKDLVALRQPADKDMLSIFLQNHWMFGTTNLTSSTEHYKEIHVTWVATVISMLATAVLLLGAIVALRMIENRDSQLGLIGMFMALLAASVAVLTNARRAEVFAATAAYAAVLVVFVSSSPPFVVGRDCTYQNSPQA